MQTTRLGRTGLQVSRLCLGTMNFGWDTDESHSHAVMDKALAHGINFFDTANVYGWKLGEGITEQIMGRWFAQGGGRRKKVVLATKVFNPMGEWPNQKGLSALHIRQACDESLLRLKTDYIDLYQFHHIDRSCPWEEVWQACELLVKQGKVIYFGSSNFAGWHLAQAQEAAKSRHFAGLVCEQTKYNLLCRTPELEVIPACEGYGLGLIPWSPLAGGALAGGASKGIGKRRQHDWTKGDVKKHAKTLSAYERLCKKWGESPADVSLAWLLANPVVTAPIIGPRTMDQLDGSLRALKIKLDKKRLAELDKIFRAQAAGHPKPMPGSSAIARHRLLAYAGLYFFWGTTFLAIRVAVPFVPPFLLSGLRHFSAGLLLLALARSRGTAWPSAAQATGSALLGVLFLAVANGTCAWAMQYVESGYATLFIAGVPLVVVAYGAGLQGKHIKAKELSLLLLGLAGVGLLLMPKAASAHVSAWAGLVALAAATIVWSVAMAEKGRFAAPKDPWMATSLQMLGGGAALLLTTLILEQPWAVDWAAVPTKAWAAWAYLVVFGSCIGYGAFNYLLQRDPPHLVGTYSYVNPLVAITLGHLILGEALSPVLFVSGGLVVASVAGLLWLRR